MTNPPLRPRPWFDADRIEKVLLTLAFSYFSIRMVGSYLEAGSPISLIFLLNEGCIVAFVLIRRRTDAISRRPADWLLGFGGTLLPLFLLPAKGEPLLSTSVCSALMLLGFATHLSAKLTLRRSFGVIAANRGVKLSGPYKLVRHPMYAGYMLSQAALVLSGPSLQNILLVSCAWLLQIGRIVAEERLLREDESYRGLMLRTQYRLVPGVF